jgi:hypothetical protein
MLNAGVVNGGRAYFRRRIFANLLPFLAGFHDSGIRLNISADLKLTIIRCIRRGQALRGGDIFPALSIP